MYPKLYLSQFAHTKIWIKVRFHFIVRLSSSMKGFQSSLCIKGMCWICSHVHLTRFIDFPIMSLLLFPWFLVLIFKFYAIILIYWSVNLFWQICHQIRFWLEELESSLKCFLLYSRIQNTWYWFGLKSLESLVRLKAVSSSTC